LALFENNSLTGRAYSGRARDRLSDDQAKELKRLIDEYKED